MNKLSKKGALNKIKELEEYVRNCDKPKKLVASTADNYGDVEINGGWAYTLFAKEDQGDYEQGSKISGHKAMLYLNYNYGQWFTEDGTEIKGYLYYKPDEES